MRFLSLLLFLHISYAYAASSDSITDQTSDLGHSHSLTGVPIHAATLEHRDGQSPISSHESDDEELKALIAEAHTLQLDKDIDVKNSLRDKRRLKKEAMQRTKIAEMEERKATFLAKIKGPREPEAAGGAGGSSAVSTPLTEKEINKITPITSALSTALAAEPKEVPIEQLTWFFAGIEDVLPSVTLAVNLFTPSEKTLFIEQFKKLRLIYRGQDNGRSTMNAFAAMLSNIPVDHRLIFINHLVTLSTKNMRVTNNTAAALARVPYSEWNNIIEAIQHLDGKVNLQEGDKIIGCLMGASAALKKRAIEKTCDIIAPFGRGVNEEYFARFLSLIVGVRNIDAFEAQIFKALKPEHLENTIDRGKHNSAYDKVYAVVQSIAGRL